MTTVAVIGGGNIGTLMAAEASKNGCSVRLSTRDADQWNDTIEVYDSSDELLYSTRLQQVTSEIATAMKDADWVFVTHPSSRFEVLSETLVPLVEPGQKIVVVPGADAEFFFSGVVERGASLLGLQRVHSIARLRERGRSVYQLGKKASVQLASIPIGVAAIASKELAEMLDMPVQILPNYLVETLTPSNPILHTTRLATMFRNWTEGVAYPRNILFYEAWDDESSQLLIDCDEELQALCRVIEKRSGLDLSGVLSLTEYYESPDARSMTEKISHIPAFRGLTSPMREVANGRWVPDFSSRYFVADFEIGLRSIIDVADTFAVEVPKMRSVIGWYEKASQRNVSRRIVTEEVEEIIKLYK